MAFFAFLPMKITTTIGWTAGFFGYHVLHRYRERARKHLKMAFGSEYSSREIDNIVKKLFRHMGRGAGEAMKAPHIIANLSKYVVFEGDSKEKYLSAIQSDKGVIFCSGHIGNWELFSQVIGHIGGPINIVARKTFDPRVTRLVAKFRSSGGAIPLWRAGRRLGGDIAAVLNRGEVMGFLIDQDLKVPGIFVPFFGRPAHTASSPAHFAMECDATIILGIMVRKGKRYHVQIDTIDVPENVPKKEAVYQVISEITAQYEKVIRAYPEQWIWMHRRWRQKP